MYLPLLRGKQFELIALRDISNIMSENPEKISPIIEPVKKSFSTLRLTLEFLIRRNINFTLILNPVVGELTTDYNEIVNFLNENISDYSNFQIGFYITTQDSITEIIELANAVSIEYNGITLIHLAQIPDLSRLSNINQIKEIKYNVINSARVSRRYYKNFAESTRVTLDDYFNILSRNSDYSNIIDEPFTDEHLYYKEDGYIGFSDYLTIGEPYAESGFLPYAVVIHLTYPISDNSINIHHFVSDSNEDTSDIAGKFSEALNKLIEWLSVNTLHTIATGEFTELHESGHFPGLGTIKKLSIMNHIEIILNLI